MIPVDAAMGGLVSLPGCALVELAGERAIDGVQPRWGLHPKDGPALAEAVSALRENGLAAIVRGGGNRLAQGNPPTRGDVLLSMERVSGIEELDADEGVCRARGGTALSEIREAANASGWELPLDAPGAGATLGGVVAAAATGPRAHGFGAPREILLGLDVVLGTGERTRCGGRVVKNVTGYDLAKLYTGSLGTLGVIEAIWLRLCPLPERVVCYALETSGIADACRVGLQASRRASVRAVALASSASGARVALELAGQEAAVQHDGHWLSREFGARQSDVAALDELRGLQLLRGEAPELRFRFSILASRFEKSAVALTAAGAAILAHPGRGLLEASFPVGASREDDGEGSAAAYRVAAELASSGGGGFSIAAAPRWVKEEHDTFGAPREQIALFRALKESFDPDAVLNPGRMAGGL